MNINKLSLLLAATWLIAVSSPLSAQELHARWDELTASDWPKALERSGRICILPIGILEKHGPHAPIGSDLIQYPQCLYGDLVVCRLSKPLCG